jgi:hypothetical protein
MIQNLRQVGLALACTAIGIVGGTAATIFIISGLRYVMIIPPTVSPFCL